METATGYCNWLRKGKWERTMTRQSKDEKQIPFTTQSQSFPAFLSHTDQKSVTQGAIIDGLQRCFPSICQRAKDSTYEIHSLYVGVAHGGVKIPLTKQLMEAKSR